MITIDDRYICLTKRMPKILNWVEIKETKKLKHEIIVHKKKKTIAIKPNLRLTRYKVQVTNQKN